MYIYTGFLSYTANGQSYNEAFELKVSSNEMSDQELSELGADSISSLRKGIEKVPGFEKFDGLKFKLKKS